ncbi:MAG: hypothetical protein ACPGJE_03255, partial [Wenzhouxiangellaceae bacterium]
MSERDNRIEPTFELEPLDPPGRSEAQSFRAESRHFETESRRTGPHYSVRLALFAITAACLVFIIDIGLDRAIEYRATRQLQQEAQALADELERNSAAETARLEQQRQR